MARYDELTPKARAAYEAKVRRIMAEKAQERGPPAQPSVNYDLERVRERSPPENPQRGPADADYERDNAMIEKRAQQRRIKALKRDRQRAQPPAREL